MNPVPAQTSVPFVEDEQASWSPSAILSPEKPLAGRTVLVVEDEMLLLMDTEDMLLDLGCARVVAAATVPQALAFIQAARPDAALLDLNVNGERSFVIADALAAQGVPFAFATGYGAHGLREVDSHRPMLTKPYRDHELARTMTGLFSG